MTAYGSWLAVIVIWAVGALALLGLGSLARALLRPASDEVLPPAVDLWLGFAVAVGFVQLWNLVEPIDARAVVTLLALAVPGLFLQLRRIRRPSSASALCAVAVGVLALYVARLAMSPISNGDACVYWIESIRWPARYAVTPGLGLLNLRLGFNHSYYLLAALFDATALGTWGEHLPTGFFVLGLEASALAAFARSLRLGRQLPSDLLLALLGFALLDDLVQRAVANPQADCTIAVLDAVCICWTLAPRLDGTRFSPFRLRALGVVACAAVVTKPSAALAAVPLTLFAAYECRRGGGLNLRDAARGWVGAAAITLVITGTWMVRGVILTGYPLFPLTFFGRATPWALSPAALIGERAWELHFAQVHTVGPPGNTAWLWHWLTVEWPENREFFIPAATAALGLLTVAVGAWRRRQWPASLPALAPLVASLCWWVAAAPAARFAEAMLWALAFLAATAAFDYVRWEGVYPRPLLQVLLVGLVGWGAFWGPRPLLPRQFEASLPQKATAGHLASGEPIPIDSGCCLDPPCGSPDAERLALRRPGDWQSGFVPNRK